jgi:uncharacterized protein (DUF1697 family)
MARLAAFLRAINVGGHTVTMDDLRTLFRAQGFGSVETFIASGNVVFDTRAAAGRALERRIADRLAASLGYEVATFVRTGDEVRAVAGHEPFTAEERARAGALVVGFLAEPLAPAGRKALMDLRTDIDDFEVRGREVFWLCRRKQNESTFSNAVFERVVKARATFRSTTTVVRLAAKYFG